MSNTKKEDPGPEPTPETIDFEELEDVSGGGRPRGFCGPPYGYGYPPPPPYGYGYGGPCPPRYGGVAYTHHVGFGIDPVFMIFALALFSQNSKPSSS